MAATPIGFHGRDAELRIVRDALSTAAAGRMTITLVEGEAGIGKTRLLDEALVQSASDGWLRAHAVGDDLGSDRPFGVLADALGCRPHASDAARARVGSLLAEPGSVASQPGLRFAIVDAFVDLVEALASSQPVVLRIEDIHVSDAATLQGLPRIVRQLEDRAVALLLTFRPAPRVPALERLVPQLMDAGATHLTLTGLGEQDVAALAQERLEREVAPDLLGLLAGAAGNPLYVLELLDGLNAEGELSVVDGQAHSATIGMPPSLRLTLVRRISYLSDDALAAARIAAVLHTGFTVADASLLLGRPVPELIGPFDEMRRARLIVEVDGLLRFRHELIREAIYEDLPISARAALHQKAGLALAASGAPAVQVAAHFGRGATRGDANAVAWLQRAAREEQARSPEGAVSLLARAVEIDGADGAAADELRAELASALVWSGRVADGQALARELTEADSPDVRRDARLTLLRAAWLEGRWSELIDLTTQYAADPSTDARTRARLIAERAFAKVFVGDPEGTAEDDAVAALAYGEEHGDDVITFLGLYGLTPVLDFQARYADELAVAQRAVEIAERTKAEEILRLHPHFALAMALRSVERYDEAAETFRVGLAVRERLGTVWDQPLYHAGLALLAFETGRWDDASVEAETALGAAAEVGTVMGTSAAGSLLALVMLHRDSVDEAAAYLDPVYSTIAASGPQWGMFWVYLARARLAEARGEPAEALSVLRECWDVHAAFPGVRMWGAVDLVRACLTLGESDLAADVALTVEAIASAAGTATASGAAHLCRGLVDDDVTELVGAVEAYRGGGRVHDLAVACERAGAALADHGQRDDARALMHEAVAVYERLGAQRDQRRAAAVMRELGFRRGSRMPHSRAATGWDALTATERQVASLAAAGLTNPEIGARLFISRRTVQTHLSHVFAKLAIRSRVELAALAASRN